MSTKPKTVVLDVELHQGKVIMQTARTYLGLTKVLLEVIQNSIDSGANRISVEVNLKKRNFLICDNGSGCSVEKFQQALRSLYDSMKGEGKYGQFGQGLVAPLCISEIFTFFSCASPHFAPYFAYVFNRKLIEPCKKVLITGTEIIGQKFDPQGKFWWRTAVEAVGITTDGRESAFDVDEFNESVSLRFGDAIRARNILITTAFTDKSDEKVSKNVVAPEYLGEPIEVENYGTKDTGKLIIELYTARLGTRGRKGKVKVGTTNNPSCISIAELAESTRGLLNTDTARCLSSGVFEGRILCEHIKMHPERTRFEDNDALLALCQQLNVWYENQGKKITEELRERDGTKRFQDLSKLVMPFAKELLKQGRYAALARSISVGTIGKVHAKVADGKILGPDPGGTSIATTGGKTATGKDKPRVDKPDGPPKEHIQHIPGTIYGPEGRRRTEVIDSSTGLRFAFEEMVDITIPFKFETATGTIIFNVDHPNWGQCGGNDKDVVSYQKAVVTQAFSLELFRRDGHPPDPQIVEFAWANLREQVFMIRNDEAFTPKK